jgi:hypothetical protein
LYTFIIFHLTTPILSCHHQYQCEKCYLCILIQSIASSLSYSLINYSIDCSGDRLLSWASSISAEVDTSRCRLPYSIEKVPAHGSNQPGQLIKHSFIITKYFINYENNDKKWCLSYVHIFRRCILFSMIIYNSIYHHTVTSCCLPSTFMMITSLSQVKMYLLGNILHLTKHSQ